MKVDDPVGAISVHGTCGAWGVLSLGLFSDGTYGDGFNGVEGTVRGLFYGGASQFVAQIIGTATCFAFIFGASWAFFKVYDMVFGMRVSPEIELEGLDVPEMGGHGYPEVQGPATLVHSMGVSTPKTPAMAMAPERAR
jgi:Amt family ammonium transporter